MRRLAGLLAERTAERGPDYGTLVVDITDAADRAWNELGEYEGQIKPLLQHFNLETLAKDLSAALDALDTLRSSAAAFKEGVEEGDLDERQITPAMQRTLDKTVQELERRVGAKAAQELLRKYAGEPEKAA